MEMVILWLLWRENPLKEFWGVKQQLPELLGWSGLQEVGWGVGGWRERIRFLYCPSSVLSSKAYGKSWGCKNKQSQTEIPTLWLYHRGKSKPHWRGHTLRKHAPGSWEQSLFVLGSAALQSSSISKFPFSGSATRVSDIRRKVHKATDFEAIVSVFGMWRKPQPGARVETQRHRQLSLMELAILGRGIWS